MKEANTLLTDLLDLDRNGPLPLHRQLYQQIRLSILEGKLPSAAPLPPSREFGKELGVSRNTVTTAYEQLKAEGLISARRGSATRVVDRHLSVADAVPKRRADRAVTPALRLQSQTFAPQVTTLIGGDALLPGFPDPREFPLKIWNRLFNQANRRLGALLPDLDLYAGYAPLRRALSQYLGISRDLSAHQEQIFITAGASQSLLLTTRALTNTGDVVWLEDPAYPVAHLSFQLTDLNVHPVAVDNQGMNPELESGPPPKLIYMTASYQYPLGYTMPVNRRFEWLDVAERSNAWIVEDDYDGEFRYHGQPIPALAGLNDNQRTIYMGTFSKVLSPSLRMSYVVVPPSLVPAFRQVYSMLGNESSIITQATLAELIRSGSFAKHIKRMRKLYGERRQAMEQALTEYCDFDCRDPSLVQGGLHIPIAVDRDDSLLHEDLVDAQLGCIGLSSLYNNARNTKHGLMLGFTSRSADAIAKAVRKLAEILDCNGCQALRNDVSDKVYHLPSTLPTRS